MAQPTDPASEGSPSHPPAPAAAGGDGGKAKSLKGQHALQAPTGTRDFYPAELSRLRYIQKAWRDTSIAHGFDEIDGPTFEHLDLYTIKSGEGIVSELFSFERFGGEKTFALRPEFTPTLARMYASKAASLPKPTKWFWQQNCYRAERPQRGRLREFCQWNCDIIGADSADNSPESLARMDAEIIATCIACLQQLGLTSEDVKVRVNHRRLTERTLLGGHIPADKFQAGFSWIDTYGKVSPQDFREAGERLGLTSDRAYEISLLIAACRRPDSDVAAKVVLEREAAGEDEPLITPLYSQLESMGMRDWLHLDFGIVRGLAYYTGMVFEVHEASGAERAIAGGGRYDGLIELFGGPPTPAVGFGMGDVVLSLVLQDKNKFPTDDEVAEKLGLTPDVLVVSNGTPEADAQVAPTLAALRRAGLHARRSYKTTKNVGKLIQDAAKLRARSCVIIESGTMAKVKDMRTQEQVDVGLDDLVSRLAS